MKTSTRKPIEAELEPLRPGTVLLSLDVSSTAIGWSVFKDGVFAAAGLIKAGGRSSRRRIEAHTDELAEVVREYGITRVAMEWQSAWRAARCANATGLAVLGQAQGAAFWELRRRGLPTDLVSERAWTKVGGWPASKASRAERVRLMCRPYHRLILENPRADPGLDMADSIGLGYWRLSIR